VHQDRFGDLQLQALRRQAGIEQSAGHDVDRLAAPKLHGRNARDVLFEDTGQVAALPQPVLDGALVFRVGEPEHPAPDHRDHDDAQIGRGLLEGADPLKHAMGSNGVRGLGEQALLARAF
jgi:hypothetical protein